MDNPENQNTPAQEQKTTDPLQWYAVQVLSGFENQVVEMLKQRIQEEKLSASFGQILVPTEEVVEMRAGQKRRSQRKFFPGYVLIQMAINDESWYLVKNVPKVRRFIGGTQEKPRPITEKEANEILTRMEEGTDKPKPKVLFEAGEVVRVIEGPFADFSGVVEEVNYEKNRLKVAVLIFGRPTPVELEFSQIQKG